MNYEMSEVFRKVKNEQRCIADHLDLAYAACRCRSAGIIISAIIFGIKEIRDD